MAEKTRLFLLQFYQKFATISFMEGLKPGQERDREVEQEWSSFEPSVRLNGVDGLLRTTYRYIQDREEKNVKDEVTGSPKTEQCALVILNGGKFRYGSHIPTGEEETYTLEMQETLKDKLKKRLGRPRTKEFKRPKFIERYPKKEDTDEFSRTYFTLQKLVETGVLMPPTTGDDAPTLNEFFWYTTRPMEVAELVNLLKKSGIEIEKAIPKTGGQDG